ncbi:MAG: TrkA family potassium uptake protein [Chloroflexota bacterium]
MKKQILVVGLGQFGKSVASTLFNMGHEVLAIDTDERSVQAIASQITHAAQADATDEAVLRELGAGNFDLAVVTIAAEIENSVLCTILLRNLGVSHIIARANNKLHGSILERIGAEKVVYPEQEMGDRIAHEIEMGEVTDYLALGEKYSVAKVLAPPYCVEKTLLELGFGPEGKWKLAVLLIHRQNEAIISPTGDETINTGDTLIIAGDLTELDQLLAEAKK